ncbi:glycosyltransferase family 2 protein [Pedobacter montanisoli]|uniref:Glycosyltransferase family 2 protein n=1 Tax=Pedobacter montanisoli TaxID=2923277 RepID=A0ABS9ZY82_9SPHI|nr:glycosyltransferase family 2 protein [Pedobacter montanisoli]MCJ0743250.1 glycosyltransferase family 2 protein [Pedobacter montanisoli]
MKPSVAVVILNWNGKLLLEQFLPSVVKTSYENLQLIVADNASTDNSVAFVKENYQQIRLIINTQNYGFAQGYNEALKQVEADYFVLLNSDVEVSENWVSPVIELMESNKQIAVAQPKIKWLKQKELFEYAGAAGGYLDNYAFPFCKGRIFDEVEKDHNQYNNNEEVFWASGAAFFIRSADWKLANGLDPDLFAHMEEIDLCWRLKNMGKKIYYCADAEVYHLGGGTLNTSSPFKNYLNFRNNLIIMQKNLPFGEAFTKIFIRLWIDLAAWFQFLLKGNFKFAFSINKAHLHFFTVFFRTSAKRSNQTSFKKHAGTYPKSIVWAYFVNKKKKFSDLIF